MEQSPLILQDEGLDQFPGVSVDPHLEADPLLGHGDHPFTVKG